MENLIKKTIEDYFGFDVTIIYYDKVKGARIAISLKHYNSLKNSSHNHFFIFVRFYGDSVFLDTRLKANQDLTDLLNEMTEELQEQISF